MKSSFLLSSLSGYSDLKSPFAESFPRSWDVVQPGLVFLLGATLNLIVAAVATWVALRVFEASVQLLFNGLKRGTEETPGLRLTQRLETAAAIVRSLGKTAILFLAVTGVLSSLGVNVAPILASAGIVGLAVGFGAQSLVKDVISGFFIIMEDQFGVGDVIELNGHHGLVERMNLRFTQIRHVQGSLISIPNGQVATVINHSKQWARAVIDINVPLVVKPEALRTAMLHVAQAIEKAMPDSILEPAECVGVESLKDTEAIMRVQFKTTPLMQWQVSRAYREALWPELVKLKEAK